MCEQRHFQNELSFAVLNCGVNVVEDPIVSGCPDAPNHENDDLHEERYL